MKKVTNEDKNRWKIVLIKTIENREPIYYRVVNLHDYSIKTIPAYRILDEVINNGLNIINLKCNDNKPRIIDEQGYESVEGIIIVDEFDNEIDNIFDWCIDNSGIGNHILFGHVKIITQYTVDFQHSTALMVCVQFVRKRHLEKFLHLSIGV